MRAVIRYAISHRTLTYFICVLLTLGGIFSFLRLGRLEDPVFSIKSAQILTKYPGASPEEVELEVTDRLETAIQEMPQVKEVYSISRAGESIIKVDIKQHYWADKLPQIWGELRKKVEDQIPKLPPGAGKPQVQDDFGFVYGFLIALTGEGYSYKSIESYAKVIKKELGLVKDVSRVELWGAQEKVIYLDISEKQLAELQLTPETVAQTLEQQNMVVNAGFVDDETTRFRIAPTGEFRSPEEIGELILRPLAGDVISNVMNTSQGRNGSIDGDDLNKIIETESLSVIRVKDVATVRPGYREPPVKMMQFNGKPAIGIAIAGSDDSNIVEVGERLYETLEKIEMHLPAGLELHKIAWQSDLVSAAVNGFLWSLLAAIVIVLIVLMIPSGLRMGGIIGMGLVLTILGTFIVMSIFDIPLQRMSLGALIIALGMMVDNSIVVADGIAVRMRQGVDRIEAAVDATASNAFPLFAATLIAVMTFYPIFASREDAGEYCRTLFIVVATSLLLSWVISMCITPLHCLDLLRSSTPYAAGGSEFDRPLFARLRRLIQKVIHFRLLSLFVLAILLVLSIFGFRYVKQMFFPESTRPQLMIDYWAPYGTRIQDVHEAVDQMDEEALKDPLVASVTSFIGQGPPRFYLPVEPERPYQNYAQMILNFNSYKDIEPFLEKFRPWALENIHGAMIRFRKYSVGPSNTWKFEARISGPGEANLGTLRNIGEEVRGIAESSPYGTNWRLDLQNPVLKIVPEYDQKKGRWSQVSRLDLAHATKRAFDGRQIGLYREGDDLHPILLRNTPQERAQVVSHLDTVQIKPSQQTKTVPLSQVINGVRTTWENPLIMRWNRRRSITVQGAPKDGITYAQLKGDVGEKIENVKLPAGYNLFWDGEEDSATTAQASLIPGIIPAVILILVLLVAVFNKIRPILIILLTIPFAMIGITAGLLIFHKPFGFMALLGAMSLAGMMNKNIIILLDACTTNSEKGMSLGRAIVEASVSRARPVLLAAGTTILGVVPLVFDVFWESMAVTIMAGLAFGSLLTLVAVPVLYAFFYRVKE